ncbi:MAG: hypothetical protein J0L85_07480 [Zoogloea sp.]|nr:hypothetical protein [Zoogloea sp.]
MIKFQSCCRRIPRLAAIGVLGGLAAFLAPASSGAAEASAGGADAPAYSITGNVSFNSDYVWRGLTQTFGGPAVQFGADWKHRSGLYAGFWASNVSEKWVPGANLETDYYAGYKTEIASGLLLDLNLLYVYYPGGDYSKALDGRTFQSSRPHTLEPSIGLSYQWASIKYGRTLSKFYGWNVNNSAPGVFSAEDVNAGVKGSTRGSQYLELGASYDVSESVNLSMQLGREWVANSSGLDWSYLRLGVSKALVDNWSVGLSVWGTTQPAAFKNYAALTGSGDTESVGRTRAVLSIARAF